MSISSSPTTTNGANRTRRTPPPITPSPIPRFPQSPIRSLPSSPLASPSSSPPPRLIVLGGMAQAVLAVSLFTKAEEGLANGIAAYLETQILERHTIELTFADQAIDQAAKLGYDQPDCRGMVLASDQWHPGVIG